MITTFYATGISGASAVVGLRGGWRVIIVHRVCCLRADLGVVGGRWVTGDNLLDGWVKGVICLSWQGFGSGLVVWWVRYLVRVDGDLRGNNVMKSQWLGLILLLRVALGPVLGPHVLEREVCV